MATLKQIVAAIEKGTKWLKTRQEKDGSYGKWGIGSTCLAVMALVRSNVPITDPAVVKAIYHILCTNPYNSTYFRSLTVIALNAFAEKTPCISERVRLDTEWLIQAQGKNPNYAFTYEGWGVTNNTLMSDGSSTQFALLALHSAELWGLMVPQETWERAATWYQRNYDVNKNGSFIYGLHEAYNADDSGVVYSMTSGALLGLKIISMYTKSPAVRDRAQKLASNALSWLSTNYMVRRYPYLQDVWYYYYLYSLKEACINKPRFSMIGIYDWYDEMANCLLSLQHSDGKWVSEMDLESTKTIHTSFALLALAPLDDRWYTDNGVAVPAEKESVISGSDPVCQAGPTNTSSHKKASSIVVKSGKKIKVQINRKTSH